jgi:hypothetical protein
LSDAPLDISVAVSDGESLYRTLAALDKSTPNDRVAHTVALAALDPSTDTLAACNLSPSKQEALERSINSLSVVILPWHRPELETSISAETTAKIAAIAIATNKLFS